MAITVSPAVRAVFNNRTNLSPHEINEKLTKLVESGEDPKALHAYGDLLLRANGSRKFGEELGDTEEKRAEQYAQTVFEARNIKPTPVGGDPNGKSAK